MHRGLPGVCEGAHCNWVIRYQLVGIYCHIEGPDQHKAPSQMGLRSGGI